MAITKNAYARYCIIDECLMQRAFEATKENIINRIEEQLGPISRRQFEHDIVAMGTPPIDAPIEHYRDGKLHLYRYINPEKTLHKYRVPEHTLMQISDTLKILYQMKGAPFLDPMQDFLEENLRKHNKSLPKNPHPAVLFEENSHLRGLEYFKVIYESIINQSVLIIDYQEFSRRDGVQYRISPYLLKNYNQRWFLFGKNHDYEHPKRIWNIPLDRIKKIRVCHQTAFIGIQFYDWRQHFNEIIGVTFYEDKAPVRILLKYSKDRLPYVKTKPLHPSQHVEIDIETGEELIGIKVRPNRELIQRILSYGADVEVLSPPSIRDEIQRHLTISLNRYKKS